MTLRIFLIVISLLICLSILGQSTKFDFPISRYGKEMGLKSNDVLSIARDTFAVLWVGTTESVYRFEGNEFTRLNNILGNNQLDYPIQVIDLYIDKDNLMWIGTRAFGVFTYDIDANKLKKLAGTLDNGQVINSERVYGLHTLNDSTFRMTLHDTGPVDYFPAKDSFRIVPIFTDSVALQEQDGFQLMVRPVFDKEKVLFKDWYSSLSGMVKYDQELDTFYYFNPPSDSHLEIRNAVVDSDGIIWCATYSEGLWSFDSDTKNWENHRCTNGPNSYINCLNAAVVQIYDEEHIIVGAYYEAYLFNKKSGEFIMFKDHIPNCAWSAPSSRMEWYDGKLWIASYELGLLKHDTSSQDWNKNIYAHQYVNNFKYNSKLGKYYATYNSMSFGIYHGNGLELIDLSNKIKNDWGIGSIYWDKMDRIWFNVGYHLYYYNYITKKLVGPFDDQINLKNQYQAMDEDSFGNLWLSAYDGAVVKLNLSTLNATTYSDAGDGDVLIDIAYRSNLEQTTDDGKVWFRGQNNFFYYDNKSDKFSFAKDLKDENGNLFSMPVSPTIAVNKNGLVYFGTRTDEIFSIQNGPLEGQSCKQVIFKNKIISLRILDMVVDSSDRIWMATESGLAMANTIDSTYYFFGEDEGLQDLNTLYLKNENELLISSNYTFHIIDMNKAINRPAKHNIQIVSVERDGIKLSTDQYEISEKIRKFEFGPTNKFLRIKFNDYTAESKFNKSYAYKLDNSDWTYIGETQEVFLTNPPRGKSKLFIKSKLKYEDVWSEPKLVSVLSVKPPLLKRIEVKLFILILLGLIGLFMYRYRMRQLREKQSLIIAFNKQIAETEMKALRAQMNPHFLFNVLNAIKLNVQKNNQEEAISFITDFSKLIRSVLQNSGKKTISLAEELEALELYVKIEKKRFDSSIIYSCKIDPMVDPQMIKIPPLLLQPYVENAIWHGILHNIKIPGEIHINVQNIGGVIMISIKDNGIGRVKANQLKLKSAQKKKSMGMQITQDRMAMSNQISDKEYKVEILDLYNLDGTAAGTEAVITISDNES